MATYQFDSYRFTKPGLLWEDEQLVPLTPLQRRMLSCFCRQPRELICKDALIEQAWGRSDVSEMSLARLVHGLRCKLGNAGKGAEIIRNIYGEGYIFTPAVESIDDAPPAPAEPAVININATSWRRPPCSRHGKILKMRNIAKTSRNNSDPIALCPMRFG